MLELIIDKKFLWNYYFSCNDTVYHQDFEKFLKYLNNFSLILDFNSLDDLEKEIENYPILTMLFEKVPKINYRPNLVNEIEEIAKNHKSSPFKLFCLEKEDSYCESIKTNWGYPVFSVNNIEKEWEVFYSENENIYLKVTNDDTVDGRFDNWEKLDYFTHPFNAIIILDNYLLTDKDNQKIEDNLFPLLKNLIKNSPKNEKTEIMLICQEVLSKDKGSTVETAYNFIRSYISNLISPDLFSLSLIKHDKKFYVRDFEGLHHRAIYTNCFCIKPDNSFNFFKPNGKVGNPADIHFLFNFRKINFEKVLKDLKDISNYISKVKNQSKSENLPEEINYYPNKENRLLI
jgi:hypothetical protein